MKLNASGLPVHLTYCLNIHPGEAWDDVVHAVRTYPVALRRELGHTGPLGLGLRLGNRAAVECGTGRRLAEFAALLADLGFYVFTINGFPYGQFHATRVKEQVYAPDWRSPERVAYTVHLAEILAALLPEDCPGSISTVPGAYRSWIRDDAARQNVMAGLGEAAVRLAAIRQRTGRHIWLAVEPEPDCLWDSTADLLSLFGGLRAAGAATAASGVAAALRDHLGVCFDTCHLAVTFEDVTAALARLLAADVPVAKIQVSAAPAGTVTPAALGQLTRLAEPVYLHQTAWRQPGGRVIRFPDLPEALAGLETAALAPSGAQGEVRTHFHIPLSLACWEALGSTRAELTPEFFGLLRRGVCPQVELETYTFSVLPEELRARGVVASLADEFRWFLSQWG